MISRQRRKRLRKRSDANSTAAKRLKLHTFYLDESIYSKRLVEAMRRAGATAVTPFEAGLAGSSDEDWLSAIGLKRYLALLRDKNVRRRALERRSLIAAGVGAFVFMGGEATAEETAAAVIKLLNKMVNIGSSERRPFLYTFGLGGKIARLPHHELR